MHYAEYAPSERLADVVRCLWTLEGQVDHLADAVQPILPDGRPEIVVHLADPFEVVHDDGAIQRQPRIIFAGQLTSPLVLRPTGRIAVVGIRLHADGAPALVRTPQDRVAGQTVDLRDVSAALARELRSDCAVQPTVTCAAGAALACLERHFNAARIDRHVRAAVSMIRRQCGTGSVDEAAAFAGLSRRQLERRFQEVVGLSPKRFSRITRFQNALRVFEQIAAGHRGAMTAAACGYADQAHFIRDFGELAGCSPEAHLLRDSMLNRLFAETAIAARRPQMP